MIRPLSTTWMLLLLLFLASDHIEGIVSAESASTCAPKLLNNMNLNGGGYMDFLCDTAEECRASCCADQPHCAAFSFTISAITNGSTKHHNCTVGSRCCYLKDQSYRPPHHQSGITSGIVIASPAPAPAAGPPRFSQTRPNILFLVVDDLRPEINAFGSTHMYTPHLDALANESLVLHRAYVQQAVCGPSRASFLTGRRPDSTRTVTHAGDCKDTCYWRHVGETNFTSLPQAFRNNGYYTASFGKTFDPRTSGGDCDQAYSWSQAPVLCSTAGTGSLNNPNRTSHYGVTTDQEPELVDPPILDAALNFLSTYDKTMPGSTEPQPFFMAGPSFILWS